MCIRDRGRAIRTGPNSVTAFVAPHLISKANPIANVDGVMNGISVKGDAVGEAMFFGPGAGALPTASAVAADMIDCVRDPATVSYTHLDVYKRQSPHCSPWRISPSPWGSLSCWTAYSAAAGASPP